MDPDPATSTGASPATGSKQLKVMVGIDDSEESFYALSWALNNIINTVAGEQSTGDPSQGERCLLYIIHVQQPFQSYAFPAGPGGFVVATSVVESVTKAQAQIAESLSARAMKICKDKQVRSETLIMEGNPKEMICQAAEQMHVDLLVVGSRGLGQVKRAFLGSVSDYCAHHAACPVLIVKPPKTPHRK